METTGTRGLFPSIRFPILMFVDRVYRNSVLNCSWPWNLHATVNINLKLFGRETELTAERDKETSAFNVVLMSLRRMREKA